MFNFLRTKKIGVAVLDNRIQIIYNHRTTEYPFANKIFSHREVSKFEECEMFIRHIFKGLYPFLFRIFGNLEVYVTNNPLSGDLEIRALNDLFKTERCVRQIHLIDFPTAACIGLSLNDKSENILIDLDEDVCYISVLNYGTISRYKEVTTYNSRMENAISHRIKMLTDDKYREMNIWLIGDNENIVSIHCSLQKILKKKIHLFVSGTIISKGVDIAMH